MVFMSWEKKHQGILRVKAEVHLSFEVMIELF